MECIKRDDDVENQKTYTQKELDEAKKLLQWAFVDFYTSLGFLSSYRYNGNMPCLVFCVVIGVSTLIARYIIVYSNISLQEAIEATHLY